MIVDIYVVKEGEYKRNRYEVKLTLQRFLLWLLSFASNIMKREGCMTDPVYKEMQMKKGAMNETCTNHNRNDNQ